MPVPYEKFVKQLEDSGILAGDTIKDFIPPMASPKDAEELARELVRKKKLTKFQAEEVYKGKARSLVLGNYVLMEKIGAGGMGQVFKAEHRRMKRLVAIKLLPTNMTKDAAAIARFEREVTAAAKLRHPNIVAADDADCANGVHFLVMEMVEGSDLSALVKKNGPFAVEKAVRYILQAAKGLEFAHQEGVVHRDIKPANLLLDKKGTVKILDMGLARLNGDGDAPAQADLTSTGTIMGTVDYMAPEQALDTKTADARADIYALGCSLYYLLTGNSVYDGDSLMRRLLAHREQPIPSLRTILPEVTEQLDVVFRKLIAKNVEDRYQSMTEVIADMEQCTSGSTSSVTIQQLTTTTVEDTTFNFFKTLTDEPSRLLKAPKKMVSGWANKNRLIYGGVGAAFLGLAILASIIVSLKIKSGGKTPITAKLVPVEEKPAMAATKPAANGLKKPLFFRTPGFEPWAKEVAALPAEQQLEAVSKKLMKLNPGFDGKLTDYSGTSTPKIENGVVTQLGFLTDNMTDISPVQALTELRQLSIYGGTSNQKLSDLLALKGMPLTLLGITGTNIADLSPLVGMNLLGLHCGTTPVSDLSPLKGMPLISLQVHFTQVSDLSPLKGMPLQVLICFQTKVADLKPLMGMPLNELQVSSTQVSDLTPLKDLPLQLLIFDFKSKKDTELLRSIKTLVTINNKPAAEFWKEVEGK